MRRISHFNRLKLLAFASATPGLLATAILLWHGDYDTKVWFTCLGLAAALWLFFSVRLFNGLKHPLQSASNMLSAVREGDFSLHPSHPRADDPLGELMLEISLLTAVMSEQRMEALEATALLSKVIAEVDAAVLTFDPDRRITLANPIALQLLECAQQDLIGRFAAEFNLDAALEAAPNSTIPRPVGDASQRFAVRRGSFRVDGKPHSLLILIDVSRTLRDEELLAWKRLIRVLGHEINNSMSPIRSIADSLRALAAKPELDAEDREDLSDGLEVILQRSNSLTRFIADYARLAKLPPPNRRPVDLAQLIDRVAALYSDAATVQLPAQRNPLHLTADPEQIEQAMVNLLKNAVEAAAMTHGSVQLNWFADGQSAWVQVIDSGPGIANPDNLFIPFFSTKPSGSGIGLALSRQIVEGHGGSLQLTNRDGTQGAIATLRLPLSQ